MKNMTLQNIAKAAGGTLYISGIEIPLDSEKPEFSEILKTEAASVVIDSRLVGKNGIFVAYKGERADGHSFISKVFENGALGVICEHLPEDYSENSPGAYILVKDSLQSLKPLAKFYRDQLNLKIVGIVGSVGKTSTKELVASVLSRGFNTLKTDGNFNNEVGVPLTLFRIRDEHSMAVVEMGISDFGEMDRLGTMVRPDAAVMTNIGPCHLENLKDLNGVLRAKSEVIRYIKQGGLLILNTDDEKLNILKKIHDDQADAEELSLIPEDITASLKGLNIISYGKTGDISFSDPVNLGVEGSSFTLNINSCSLCADTQSSPARVHLQGSHMIMNSLAACAAGLFVGMDLKKITAGIEASVPVKGRCCPVHTDRYLVVDDSYNANPKSMMAAADLMNETDGRHVLIFGDMFELGENEKELHYNTGVYAADKNIDIMVCTGELSKNMINGYLEKCRENGTVFDPDPSNDTSKELYTAGNGRKAFYFKDREALLKNLDRLGLCDGDAILVKASHGMGFAEVVDILIKNGTRYQLIKGRENMKIDDIMELLSQTHWACKRSRETVERSIENSLCFGMLDENGRQVAFGRTVTDYATMFYVSDVVLDKSLHKKGLGKRFVEFIKAAPELKNLWGFLGTTKASGFYEKCGFEKKDDFFMALPKTNVNGIFNV